MTNEEKEKLKDLLYQAKFIIDKENEDPFVSMYLVDLIDLLEDYKNGNIWPKKIESQKNSLNGFVMKV